MMTKKMSFLAIVLVLALVFPGVVVQAASPKLNMSECTLMVGQKQQLTLKNATGKVTWSTSAKKVATVSKKGVVTAKKAGSAVIVAKNKGKNYVCVVTVVKRASLNETKLSLNIGDTYKLNLKNAKASGFVSEDDSIATVSSKGVVKGKSKGKTTITVLDSSNNVYTCKVTVLASGKKSTGSNDLEGINIIIHDCWSPSLNQEYPGEPHSDYEESKYASQDKVMKKYNFTMREAGMSVWNSNNDDFVNYVKSGGDDNYFIFALTNDDVLKIMKAGYMYDLSTLDCLDFSEDKFQRNKVHERFTIGRNIYGMKAGYSEPGVGVYFNKTLLREAGIDPDIIYDAQKNGTWTWDMFEEIMAKCQRDTNADGVYDIYGLTCNENIMTKAAVLSNGGSFVEKNSDRKEPYVYNLESAETLEALSWCTYIYTKYDNRDQRDAKWYNYQEEWKSGTVAFCVDNEYLASSWGEFSWTDFDMGFVMFPKGPKASDYVNNTTDVVYVIPSCYDADKAWKIAFAWNEWTNSAPGYEDFNEYIEAASNGNFDERALYETLPMMFEPNRRVVTYEDFIGLDVNGFYLDIKTSADLSALIEKWRNEWKKDIKKANG